MSPERTLAYRASTAHLTASRRRRRAERDVHASAHGAASGVAARAPAGTTQHPVPDSAPAPEDAVELPDTSCTVSGHGVKTARRRQATLEPQVVGSGLADVTAARTSTRNCAAATRRRDEGGATCGADCVAAHRARPARPSRDLRSRGRLRQARARRGRWERGDARRRRDTRPSSPRPPRQRRDRRTAHPYRTHRHHARACRVPRSTNLVPAV